MVERRLPVCPRCGGPFAMEDLFTGGRHATIARCGDCGGQWMKTSDLERLAEVVQPVVVEWRRVPSEAVQRHLLRCPVCSGGPALKKMTDARDAKVVIDWCGTCGGVFLDAGELKAIQQESLLKVVAGLLESPPKDEA